MKLSCSYILQFVFGAIEYNISVEEDKNMVMFRYRIKRVGFWIEFAKLLNDKTKYILILCRRVINITNIII